MSLLILNRKREPNPLGGLPALAALPFEDRQRLLRQRRRRRRWRYGMGLLSCGLAALAGIGLALVELLYGFSGS